MRKIDTKTQREVDLITDIRRAVKNGSTFGAGVAIGSAIANSVDDAAIQNAMNIYQANLYFGLSA